MKEERCLSKEEKAQRKQDGLLYVRFLAAQDLNSFLDLGDYPLGEICFSSWGVGM